MTVRRVVSACAMLALIAGCSGNEDIRTRYELERMMWRAQFFQRRVNIAFLGTPTHDVQRAIEAYRRVVAADPFAGGPRPGWDPEVATDIRELLVAARVALANLYFATEQYTDAGTLYAETLQLGSMNFKDVLDVRMGAARASYMEGDQRRVIDQCAKIFQDVRDSREFWEGDGGIDDVFLNIPVALVRLQMEANDAAGADSAAAAALRFYERVSTTWPDGHVEWQARLAVAQLHMLCGRWAAAAAGLESILADSAYQPGEAASIELVIGEIHAFRLGDGEEGMRRFEAVRERHPRTLAAYAALYDEAAVRLAQNDVAGASRQFRDLEQAPGVPAAVASRAMLARAKILEKTGAWDEAYALLRRLENLHPFTSAAIEAPLVVTRHYVASGNAAMVEMAMKHATEYYISLLDRRSAYPGNRAMVQSALAESFVAAGRAGEAARLLGTGSESWDEVSTAAGMLKAAEIYLAVLNNPGEARATLEKVIARFPDTRYARTARHRLDEISSGS